MMTEMKIMTTTTRNSIFLKMRLIGLGALLLVGTVGCRDWEVLSRIDEIKELKASALTAVPKTPYREKQHEAIAAYFSAVVLEGVAILEEDWRVPLLNAWVAEVTDQERSQMCRDLFMDRAAYETLLRSCRRNRFFLCADEVQSFDEALKRVMGKLSAENRRLFDARPECARVLKISTP